MQGHAKACGKPNELPPLILPVWWTPVDLKQYGLPGSIPSLKYTFDDLDVDPALSQKYKTEGLLQLLQLDDPDYTRFYTRFAKRMRDVCTAHVLKDAPHLGKFQDLTNAFAAAPAQALTCRVAERREILLDAPGHCNGPAGFFANRGVLSGHPQVLGFTTQFVPGRRGRGAPGLPAARPRHGETKSKFMLKVLILFFSHSGFHLQGVSRWNDPGCDGYGWRWCCAGA